MSTRSVATVATPNAYIGVQSCGCITAWMSDRYSEPKDIAQFLSDQANRGLDIERVNTDEAKARPNFMPAECPHDPKGWEPWKPEPFKPTIRYKKCRGREIRRCYVRTPWHRGASWGEIKPFDGKWWYTPGWFAQDGVVATDGKTERGPERVDGPFDTQKAAGEHACAEAMKMSRAAWIGYGRTEEEADAMLARAGDQR